MKLFALNEAQWLLCAGRGEGRYPCSPLSCMGSLAHDRRSPLAAANSAWAPEYVWKETWQRGDPSSCPPTSPLALWYGRVIIVGSAPYINCRLACVGSATSLSTLTFTLGSYTGAFLWYHFNSLFSINTYNRHPAIIAKPLIQNRCIESETENTENVAFIDMKSKGNKYQSQRQALIADPHLKKINIH